MPVIVSGSEGQTVISGSGVACEGASESTTYGTGSISGSGESTTWDGAIRISSSTGNTTYGTGSITSSFGQFVFYNPVVLTSSTGMTTYDSGSVSGSGEESSFNFWFPSITVTSSTGMTSYGTGSISGSEDTFNVYIPQELIIHSDLIVTGALYVTGNTIYNYGGFYNNNGTISGSHTLEIGGQATFANATHLMTGSLRVTSSQGIATVYGGGLTRDGTLTLQHSGSQTGVLVKNEGSGDGGAVVFLSEDNTNGQNQFGLAAANSITDSQTLYFPAAAGAADQVMTVSSVGGGGGMTTLTMGWADVSSISQAITVTSSVTYEPQGLKFLYNGPTGVTLSPNGVDGLARIPVASGSVLDMGTVTASLSCVLTTSGVGGLQAGLSEAANMGYEVRFVSGTSGQGLIMTDASSSFTKPSGYDYASDIIWFVYNKSDGNIANFMDTGRACTYGGWGPGTLDAGNSNSWDARTMLVGPATNDEWTEFSFDSQVPANARYVDTGAYFENTGGSLLHIALSGTYDDLYYYGNLLFKMGSADTSTTRDATTTAFFNPSAPALTGTLMYRFQQRVGNQDGYIWVRGWRF